MPAKVGLARLDVDVGKSRPKFYCHLALQFASRLLNDLGAPAGGLGMLLDCATRPPVGRHAAAFRSRRRLPGSNPYQLPDGWQSAHDGATCEDS